MILFTTYKRKFTYSNTRYYSIKDEKMNKISIQKWFPVSSTAQKFRQNFRFTALVLLPTLVLFFLLVLNYHPLSAQSLSDQTPKFCIGVGASGGHFNLNHRDGPFGYEPGMGFGGGIVLETMINSVFGIHSGAWYSHFELDFTMTDDKEDPSTEKKEFMRFKCNILTIPFYLITSADLGIIVINLLTGVNYSYITEAYISQDEFSENIGRYMEYAQLGAGGGLEIKIKMTRFVHLFVTGIGEYYFTNFIKAEDSAKDNLYNAQIRTGVLLSTF